MNQKLTKAERINSKLTIENIFRKGQSVFSHPYKLVFVDRINDDDSPLVEILISVSKKRFKKAVDRNAIKRLIRESYRTNKQILWNFCEQNNTKLSIVIVYVGNDISNSKNHNNTMIKVIDKMLLKLNSSMSL